MPILKMEKLFYVRHNSVFCNKFLFFSSDFEVVDDALIIVVKSESSGPSEGEASDEVRIVRIVYTPGAWGSISSPPISAPST